MAGRKLAEAFVRVRPDMATFGDELRRDTDKAGDKAGDSSGRRFGSMFGDKASTAMQAIFKRGFTEVADSSDKASVRVAGSWRDSFQAAAGGGSFLRAEIARLETSVKDLGREIDTTGNRSLLRNIGKDRSELARLRKALADVGDEGGQDAGVSFMARMVAAGGAGSVKLASGMFSSVPPEAAVALAAGVALATPAIGAAVSAAVIGGIGGATLAGGVALAVHDPAVRQAWAGMADVAKAGLGDAASVFQEPLIASARVFERAFADVLPGIRTDFQALAPVVEQLATGAAGFVKAVQPGWDSAVRAAVPLFSQLAQDLPPLGAAVGDFFSQISAGGGGATAALHDFLVVTAASVEATGFLLGNLSKAYLAMSALSDFMHGNAADGALKWAQLGQQSATTWHGAGDAAAGATGAFGGANAALQANAATVNTILKPAWDAFFSSSMGVDQAVLGLQTSLSGLTASVKNNGTSLDITTASGQANAQALYAGVRAAEQHRQAMIDSGKASAFADEQYQADIRSLYGTANQAGLTTGAVDTLIGKYRDIPGSKSTSILTPGLLDAINGASSLDSILRGIPSEKRVSVITTYYANNPDGNYLPKGSTVVAKRLGGIVAAARGAIVGDRSLAAAAVGMIARSPTVLFGERGTGPGGSSLEGYLPARGIPRARAGDLLGEMGSWWDYGLVDRRQHRGGDGGAAIVAELRELRAGLAAVVDAVQRVAPGVGRELGNAGRSAMQAARAW